MTAYFHFSQQALGPGSIIAPGNFGRLLRRYPHRPAVPNGTVFGSPWIIARELALELVRVERFPDRPSRMACSFALEDEGAAERYRLKNDPNRLQVLHRVEITDPSLPIHLGALNFIAFPAEDTFIDGARLLAECYWRGEGEGDREVITASPLRVIDRLA
jgi:hypothetical protein